MSRLLRFPHRLPGAPAALAPRQRGATLLEFAIVAPPLLLLALLAIETAHWHLVRQLAHVALLEAGRGGANAHGHPDAIARGFEQGLLPRHAHASGDAQAAQQRAWQRLRRQANMPPWRIEVLQPSVQAFQAHARPGLKVNTAAGRRAISNDYQAEQHAARGITAMGPDIFQANTLHLRLTYLHEPLAPPTRALLRLIGRDAGTCAQRAWARGLLPLRLDLHIEMQSHPVDWHAPPAARRGPVVYGAWDCARDGP
ncbi:TadE/TadG family type IV pilus assembly protein [Bordetella petrii]|uniref:TadE/TadG family type IV pilus assembly protein n=1 Tax=Bordetella petrii TaxID=94624 RepID=UPI001E4BE914|nr:TadE/TadG family type IV pilus assembly protein [Bordetella petrii]MCD0503702.1 pilus assembly protein [Bordetella petrii]